MNADQIIFAAINCRTNSRTEGADRHLKNVRAYHIHEFDSQCKSFNIII
jgi:hypothetical protein